MKHTPIYRDAVSAWQHLCKAGGIELEGRDNDLKEKIRKELDELAPTFDDALVAATLQEFALAFFKAAQGFVYMFRDILTFFQKAGAKEGRDQWKLQIDDVDLDLDDFREWLSKWTDSAKVTIEVPAIDRNGVSLIREALLSDSRRRELILEAFDGDLKELPDDVRAWVSKYNQDHYSDLPSSLNSPPFPDEFSETISIVRIALAKLGKANLTRKQLIDAYRQTRLSVNNADALNLGSIAQDETDGWLRTFVVAMSAAITELAKPDLLELGMRLQRVTSQYPKSPFEATVSIDHLESILSLPIWKERHELYSVWIATEIIRALDKHKVEIHHDNGRITFPFKQTKIATIHSSPGPFQLISERRSPLANPVSDKRKGNVQPDHGLWTTDQYGNPSCRMCVEVKHYLKSGGHLFTDVFNDYARALPDAEIYLVSHGPIGDVTSDLPRELDRRSHPLKELTSMNVEQRKRLASAVRECVGEPIETWPDTSVFSGIETALAFDVSGSMRESLRSSEFAVFVRKLIGEVNPTKLVAVNVGIVGTWPPTQNGFEALLRAGGGSTALKEPVQELLQSYERVVLVTDVDGESSIEELMSTLALQTEAPSDIKVIECQKS